MICPPSNGTHPKSQNHHDVIPAKTLSSLDNGSLLNCRFNPLPVIKPGVTAYGRTTEDYVIRFQSTPGY
ncbi:protein of unknown function [Methylocaldum szegediense]|uniref:Uncharacterized protein n=1 Tax=Methylocaldum szegediense TaxID=73780 RepID=A0ABM9I1A0_9GAMM|nr:protein of unknown function [Methylocaldum szegediense]